MLPALVSALVLALLPAAGAAQRVEPPVLSAIDTVEIAAGAAYAAGALQRTLLGQDYRELWTARLRAPVLDLDRFSGGLHVTRAGGRRQTKSLRFLDPDGREFVFRSVDKDPELARTPDLEGTFVGWLVRDQTSALFPAGALALPPLLEAAGVIHVVPHLAVMPDDPRLGEHREEFAGMLGMIEERPDEGDADQFEIAGSSLIIGTDRFRERLLEGPEDLVDSRAFLTARLVDALVNDRDRHWDQWRWARFDDGDTRYWRPIPEDRDYAFVDFDGLLPTAAGMAVPHMIAFGGDLPDPDALSYNSLHMDRRLLAELPRAAWDSVVVGVQRAITDDVIARAAASLPEVYRRLVGERLELRLRQRRDRLDAFANEWYAWLSTEVDVHGTDEAELARADHEPDGSLRVRLFAMVEGDRTSTPFFERRFVPQETREVRVYLHGSDDRAVVRGTQRAEAIVLRVIGGAGEDVLSDSTEGGTRPRVVFYDDEDEANRFDRRRGTRVDTRPFTPPARDNPITGATFEDFGGGTGTSVSAAYGSTRGVEVGVSRSWTRQGFRYVPYASEIELSAGYSFRLRAFGLDLDADWRRPNSARGASLLARATQLEPFRFFGLGNDTPERRDDDRYLVERDLLLVRPAIDHHITPRGRVSIGPIAKYSRLRPRAGSAVVLGGADYGEFGQIGGLAEATIDTRDRRALPRSGVVATLAVSAYPAVWDAVEPFGRAESAVATYIGVPGRRGPTLAVRAGGVKVWGSYPVHEAAFAGGWKTLRGYQTDRFAGDAALWGAAEARVFIGRPNLLVRGDLGGIAFVDAGRVYVDGDSPGGWHRGVGGGLYFLFELNRMPLSGSLLYARGEGDRFRIQLGAPF